MTDCTLRNIPDEIETRLRREAEEQGLSLEQAALEAVARGLGVTSVKFEYYDLEDLPIVS